LCPSRSTADAALRPGHERNLSRVASVLIRCHGLLSMLLIVSSVDRSHALPKPKLLLNKSPDHSQGSGSPSSRISRAVRRKSIELIATNKLTTATNRSELLISIKRMINSALQPNISHRCLNICLHIYCLSPIVGAPERSRYNDRRESLHYPAKLGDGGCRNN
jgi:hypothetical protein